MRLFSQLWCFWWLSATKLSLFPHLAAACPLQMDFALNAGYVEPKGQTSHKNNVSLAIAGVYAVGGAPHKLDT